MMNRAASSHYWILVGRPASCHASLAESSNYGRLLATATRIRELRPCGTCGRTGPYLRIDGRENARENSGIEKAIRYVLREAQP